MRFSTVAAALQAVAFVQAAALPAMPAGELIELVKDDTISLPGDATVDLVARKEVNEVHAIESIAEQTNSADKSVV
ncbi:uncharacterized protein BDZ83DRAFT_757299, partial [Colletotrichum acutatum]